MVQPILGLGGSWAILEWSNGVKYLVEIYSSTPKVLMGSSSSENSGLKCLNQAEKIGGKCLTCRTVSQCFLWMNLQMIAENLEAEDPIWFFDTEYILSGTGYTPGRNVTL